MTICQKNCTSDRRQPTPDRGGCAGGWQGQDATHHVRRLPGRAGRAGARRAGNAEGAHAARSLAGPQPRSSDPGRREGRPVRPDCRVDQRGRPRGRKSSSGGAAGRDLDWRRLQARGDRRRSHSADAQGRRALDGASRPGARPKAAAASTYGPRRGQDQQACGPAGRGPKQGTAAPRSLALHVAPRGPRAEK